MLTTVELDRIEAIRAKFASVIERVVRPFGFEAHRLRLLPKANEGDVRAFEELYGLSLPEDYRAFLLGVAAGGAGPGYGLVPYDASPSHERAAFPVEAVAAAFPFTEAQLLDPEQLPAELPFPSGTLVLCDEGCGYLHLLVVSGEARGQVWVDALVSDVGIFPIAPTFSDWYERWLDNLLAGGDGCWWLNE